MKTFIQFYRLSTGYIQGTIPPKFDKAHQKPIEALGSDGVLFVDGRWSKSTQHEKAREYAKARGFIGYTLGHRLGDIVDLVVVGMDCGEYKHKFSVFKDDTIPIDYFDNKQEKQKM